MMNTPKNTLYLSLRSPFARRSRLLLEELGVPFTNEFVDVFNLPPSFYALNPLGRVPALKLETGEILCDSAQIQSYLRSKHSHHPLFSTGGYSEASLLNFSALAMGIMEITVQYYLETLRGPGLVSAATLDEHTQNLKRGLNFLSDQFRGPYFTGDELRVCDLDIGSALEYCVFRAGADLLKDHPKLQKYIQHLNTRPAFQKSIPPAL